MEAEKTASLEVSQTSAQPSERPSPQPESRTCACGGEIVPVVYQGYLSQKTYTRWPELCPDCQEAYDECFCCASLREQRLFREDELIGRLEEVIPSGYVTAHLRDLDRSLVEAMLSALTGVYLWGPVGSGKTHAMAAMLRFYTLMTSQTCRRVTFNDLMLEVRASWRRRGERDEHDIVEEYRKPRRLVVEDIGTADCEKGVAIRVLMEILDWRIEHDLATYFTSNRPPEDMARIFDQRIFSRIVGGCKVIKLEGPDRRLA